MGGLVNSSVTTSRKRSSLNSAEEVMSSKKTKTRSSAGESESNVDAQSAFTTPPKRLPTANMDGQSESVVSRRSSKKKKHLRKKAESNSEMGGVVDSSVTTSRKRGRVNSAEEVSTGKKTRSSADVENNSVIMISPRKLRKRQSKPALGIKVLPRKLRKRQTKPDVGIKVSPHKNVMSSVLLTRSKQRGANLFSGKKKGLPKGNCHPDHKRHEITLKCDKCGMGFCARALKTRFPFLKDTKTGCWACPRCTGACDCKKCLAKKSGRAELELRVKELTHERNQYIDELAIERNKYNAYRTKFLSTFAKINGDYSALEDHCSLLERKLAEVIEKRETADMSGLCKECEEQRRQICELQERLSMAEIQIVEGETMRKKLHNTILELKENVL